MPNFTDEELRENWENIIDQDLTLDELRENERKKNEFSVYDDIIERTFKEENLKEIEERIAALSDYKKAHPDVIKQIEDDKAKVLEEERKRYEAEKRAREKEEAEIQARRDAQYRKIMRISEEFEKYLKEKEEKKKDEEIKLEADSIVNDVFEAAKKDLVNDRRELDAMQLNFIRGIFKKNEQTYENTYVNDLYINMRYYNQDLDYLSLEDEDLKDAVDAYDKIFGDLPGDFKDNMSRFSYSSLDGFFGKVDEYVEDYISKNSDGKSEEEIDKMNELSIKWQKATVIHAMSNRVHSLFFYGDEDYHLFICEPKLTYEQAKYYNEVFNGTIKVEDYKKPSKLDELKKEVKTDINDNIKAEAKDEVKADIKEEVKEDIKEEVKDNIPPLDLSTGATSIVLEEYELTEEDKLNFADTRGINTISDSSE
nr:hypothetical protein [Lachnospiraceae bacterium]